MDRHIKNGMISMGVWILFLVVLFGFDENVTRTMFKKAYFSDIARMLSRVFFIAVPFYVAANVKDTVTLRNCIYIGILMIISIVLYGYYKKNGTKEITL